MYLIDGPPVFSILGLLPWLASSSNLTGWLYWFTNWGWQHAPSAKDASGKLVPLP